MASAHFFQAVLIFLWGFLYILPCTESTSWTFLNKLENNLKKSATSSSLDNNNIRDIIQKQAEVIPDSDFEFNSKLIQILDEENSRTNYFIQNNNHEKLELVFTRNSNEFNESIVIFKADDCERGFDPDVYIVLKLVQNHGGFNLKTKYYYASVVYLRTDKEFPLEWDNWAPPPPQKPFLKKIQNLESNRKSNPSQLQLLTGGIGIQFNYGDQCLKKYEKGDSRIHKRDIQSNLFDSVIKSTGIPTAFFEATNLDETLGVKHVTKKPKLVAVAKAKTLHEGNAVSNAMNKKSGVALSDSEAIGIGDASASSGTYGKGGHEHKLSIAAASAGHGGAVRAVAHSDGHDPVAAENHKPEINPGPHGILAETDQEFKGVLEYTTRVEKTVKRSIRTNPKEISTLVYQDASYRLSKMDQEFITLNNLTSKRCEYCKSSAKSYRCGSNNLMTFILTHPEEIKKVTFSPDYIDQIKNTECPSKLIPIFENTLKAFNLQCNPGAISYLEMALVDKRLNHGEDGSLEISENLPILQKRKPSRSEIEDLTTLILMSAFSSANKSVQLDRESEKLKNDLFLVGMTESLRITNIIGKPHKMKLTQSISKVLQELGMKIMFEIQHCKKFELKKINKNSHPIELLKEKLLNELRILVTLERFAHVQSIVEMDFGTNYTIRDLFWKYYDFSNSIISQVIKYFIVLH